MNKLALILIGAFSLALLFGCTQVPINNSVSDSNEIVAQAPSTGSTIDVKSKFCVDTVHGWKCVLDKSMFAGDYEYSTAQSELSAQCAAVQDALNSGHGTDNNLVLYCEFILKDAGASCESSYDCIGYCEPAYDGNTYYGIMGTEKTYIQTCPDCKGECSKYYISELKDNTTDFTILDSGLLEHAALHVK
ncbi:MAG: hypothetical protein AABW59_01380 [archaeon]